MFSTMPSLVERLEREGRVGGDLRQEARVGVAVGVERLLAVRRTCAAGFRRGCAAVRLAWLWKRRPDCRRRAGGRWSAPSRGCGRRGCRRWRRGRRRRPGCASSSGMPLPWLVNGVEALPRVVPAGVSPRSPCPPARAPFGIALALVEARRADEAERRARRQVRRQLAVVGERRQIASARRCRRCACTARRPAASARCSSGRS